jgi:hypothetical protein
MGAIRPRTETGSDEHTLCTGNAVRDVAAALTLPSVQPETAWCRQRLADCTDAARREISAAIGALSEE